MSYILSLVRNSKHAIVICCAIVFLLITVFIVFRQARELPISYTIEAVNIYGQKTIPEGLRLVFATHDATESYTQFYRQIYNEQHKFRVVGCKN